MVWYNRQNIIILLIAILLYCSSLIWANEIDPLSFISGLAGIISVILCAQKKISFYIFGFVQLGTYLLICYRQSLYGEIIENIFYVITMIIGIGIWITRYDKEKYEIKPRALSISFRVMCVILLGLFTGALTEMLIMSDDPYPFLDAVSTVPAFIAQILMITGYKDQWKYWLIVDISSIVLWSVIGDVFMVIQFIIWTLNCLYGIYKWNKF